jgi:hypothetical protein
MRRLRGSSTRSRMSSSGMCRVCQVRTTDLCADIRDYEAIITIRSQRRPTTHGEADCHYQLDGHPVLAEAQAEGESVMGLAILRMVLKHALWPRIAHSIVGGSACEPTPWRAT